MKMKCSPISAESVRKHSTYSWLKYKVFICKSKTDILKTNNLYIIHISLFPMACYKYNNFKPYIIIIS